MDADPSDAICDLDLRSAIGLYGTPYTTIPFAIVPVSPQPEPPLNPYRVSAMEFATSREMTVLEMLGIVTFATHMPACCRKGCVVTINQTCEHGNLSFIIAACREQREWFPIQEGAHA